MIVNFHSLLSDYVKPNHLPLCVEYVPLGKHFEKGFHDHEYSEIAIVMQGVAKHLVNDISGTIEAGDVLVIHPGISHAYDQTRNMELINILYDRRKLSMPMLDGYSLPLFQLFLPAKVPTDAYTAVRPVIHLDKDELEKVIEKVRRLNDEIKSACAGSLLLSLAIFLEIIVTMARTSRLVKKTSEARFLIGDVISFMHKNYARRIEIDELLATVNMSRRNFFRNFHLAVGSSPIDYLTQIRLKNAAAMLLYTNKTISEIANATGFYDSNYLCKKFRERMADSPRQFRLKRSK
jgi:AraC family L-rhamnose operon transcriptional activator RhaR/AraC family L-rhamnose operon regulatory protein RhaS